MNTYRKIPIIKRLIPSILKSFGRLTWAGGYKIIKRDDMIFMLNIRNMPDRHLAFHGGYETAQLNYFLSKMKEHECDIFLDIGANFGLYSINAYYKASPIKIIAYEPDPQNYDQLRGSLLANGLSSSVETHTFAISDKEGSVHFECKHSGVSKITSSSKITNSSIKVKAVKLDDILTYKNKTIFIKMDIEGHELQALNGMLNILKNNKCFLQVESFERNAYKVEEFMTSLNYNKCHQIECDHYYNNISSSVT